MKRQMSHRERIDVEGIVLLALLFVALCAFWGLVLYLVVGPLL